MVHSAFFLTLHLGLGLMYGIGSQQSEAPVFTDPRDGEAYHTVQIGTVMWMARNLNHATPASVCYEERETHCEQYGRLYLYQEALTACPAGWTLPRPEDIAMLHKAFGKRIDALANPSLWRVKGARKFNNVSGLSVPPGGRYDHYEWYSSEAKTFLDTITFHQLGLAASYWLLDQETEEGLLHWHLGSPIGERKSGVHRHPIEHDTHRFSVRCVCYDP